ncbi:MAG: bifunctional 5,10-methylenetetrahydrofolate dehydrogenase/5,10-methenyltetrahydrofolate cyclohydrolase [Candidatus Moraniibacteriota bacterium]|nr:MAG: bifunctional 5,10-methylenetetrahydrofolate dehydrogenase/5,10-methenyltetrahydrofolate cyclohydrolase [Candidatus Moranbacteria bacterium]
MKLIEGKPIAEDILSRLEKEVKEERLRPGLGVILVGDDAASHLYVTLKERAAERIGIRVEKKFFLENAAQSDIEQAIDVFNGDSSIHGILVQVPLPAHLDTEAIINRMSLEKDVDGFHPENERRFLAGEPALFPVFPRAILELIRAAHEPMEGKNAVVIGNSYRFGNMMCRVLSRESVRAKHIPCVECSSDQGLSELKQADIVVSACGKKQTITGNMLKAGAIVIDGGIVKNGACVFGDVDRASVEGIEGFLSPVPGGVGPVTIACLLSNVVEAAKRQVEKI